MAENSTMNEPSRPRYHTTAPAGSCDPFDPNGTLYWKGRYHLFYLLQNEKGDCWGHLSSSDLVRWKRHSHALEPDGVENGIWSGGICIDVNGVPTISYWGIDHTGKNHVGVCLATSTDDQLDDWTKSPHNPVIQETEFGITVGDDGRIRGASDPSAIWRHNNRYYLLTGNLQVLHKYGIQEKRTEHQGDTAYLFTSDDLIRWDYLHPFYQSDRRWTAVDEDCMCPDFFPLGDRHVLLFISHNHGCQYYIGRYENDSFFPETHGRMSWEDKFFFAPESLLDGKGRRIMWSWILDGRKKEARAASRWSGTLSLPRVLWLGDDKTLRMAPPDELTALRNNFRQYANIAVAPGAEVPLPDVKGRSLELQIEMHAPDAVRYGVNVCCAPDGREQTAIFYDASDKKLKIDTRRSSLDKQTPMGIEGGPLELRPGEPLKLRVFVDRSVVEVFANDRQAVMRRIYPADPASLNVVLFSRGGAATATSVQAWDVAPLQREEGDA